MGPAHVGRCGRQRYLRKALRRELRRLGEHGHLDSIAPPVVSTLAEADPGCAGRPRAIAFRRARSRRGDDGLARPFAPLPAYVPEPSSRTPCGRLRQPLRRGPVRRGGALGGREIPGEAFADPRDWPPLYRPARNVTGGWGVVSGSIRVIVFGRRLRVERNSGARGVACGGSIRARYSTSRVRRSRLRRRPMVDMDPWEHGSGARRAADSAASV